MPTASTLALALSPLALGAALALLPGCDRSEPPPIASYVRPQVKPGVGKASCDELARQRPGASPLPELTLRIEPGSRLALSDPSVLGGPFEPPLEIDAPPGPHPVRVIAEKRADGARPLCAQVVLRDGTVTTWKQLGDVAVDTDMAALVDARRATAAARAQGARLLPGVDARADQMPRVIEALGQKGLPLEPVLPTFAQGKRPLEPGDARLVELTLKSLDTYGRFVIEPRPAAWAYLGASHAGPASAVDLGQEAAGAAVVIDVPQGDGAYPVVAGLDATGAVVTVELRLE